MPAVNTLQLQINQNWELIKITDYYSHKTEFTICHNLNLKCQPHCLIPAPVSLSPGWWQLTGPWSPLPRPHTLHSSDLTRWRGIHIFVKINLSPEREEENAVNTNMPCVQWALRLTPIGPIQIKITNDIFCKHLNCWQPWMRSFLYLANKWSWQYLGLTQTQTPDSYAVVNQQCLCNRFKTNLKSINTAHSRFTGQTAYCHCFLVCLNMLRWLTSRYTNLIFEFWFWIFTGAILHTALAPIQGPLTLTGSEMRRGHVR